MDRTSLARAAIRLRLYRPLRATFACLGGFQWLRRQAHHRTERWSREQNAHAVVRHRASGLDLTVVSTDPRARKLAGSGGMLDRQLCDLWRRLVESVGPDVVLDIGANYGEVVFSVRSYGGRVVIVEPNPRVAECLASTLRANSLEDYELHQVAAGHETGEAQLAIDETSSGLSRIVRAPDVLTLTVSVVPMDDLFVDRLPKRFVAKIDVEGHELAVLTGMAAMLRHATDYAIICEFVNLELAEIEYLLSRFRVSLVNRYTLQARQTSAAELYRIAEGGHGGAEFKDVLLQPVRDKQ